MTKPTRYYQANLRHWQLLSFRFFYENYFSHFRQQEANTQSDLPTTNSIYFKDKIFESKTVFLYLNRCNLVFLGYTWYSPRIEVDFNFPQDFFCTLLLQVALTSLDIFSHSIPSSAHMPLCSKTVLQAIDLEPTSASVQGGLWSCSFLPEMTPHMILGPGLKFIPYLTPKTQLK